MSLSTCRDLFERRVKPVTGVSPQAPKIPRLLCTAASVWFRHIYIILRLTTGSRSFLTRLLFAQLVQYILDNPVSFNNFANDLF